MAKILRTVLAIVACLLLVGACGDDDGDVDAGAGSENGDDTTTSTPPAGSAESSDESAGAETVQLRETSLGEVLVASDGMTLYLFTRDSGDKSACTGGCADLWPPLVSDAPTAGDGVDSGKLGTITRDDGAKQVTYDGKPLYGYAQDAEPGDVNGQAVGGVWFVVAPDGSAIRESAAPSEPSY